MLLAILTLVLSTLLVFWLLRRKLVHRNQSREHETSKEPPLKTSIAFFHPYCDAGGGGERVLWTDYTLAQDRFGIKLVEDGVEFRRLYMRLAVEDKLYPILTLLMQSLGSVLLGMEALLRFDLPDVYIDTMGYTFTYPLFKYFAGSKVVCYVHYPTISSDMLSAVQSGQWSVNNRSIATGLRAKLKIIYYRIFASIYAKVARQADRVMVNSTWTRGHIDEIWSIPSKTTIVYPPCDVKALSALSDRHAIAPGKEIIILSVAQFRPEKNHRLQLESFACFMERINSGGASMKHHKIKLVLIGGCRNEQDKQRVNDLKQHAVELGIDDFLSRAIIGLHTMWNEHFGIGVVEYLASGVIPIAHKSGGPKFDIVTRFQGAPVGFLAEEKEEYALAIEQVIFGMSEDVRARLRDLGRRSVLERFTEAKFLDGWHKSIEGIIS